MLVTHLLANKCPHCGKGHVYQNGNFARFGNSKMNGSCPECHISFTKDPGFYWGAMYVSYALAMLEAIVTYGVTRILGAPAFHPVHLFLMLLVLLLCSPFNFRMSRLIWLYLFPNH